MSALIPKPKAFISHRDAKACMTSTIGILDELRRSMDHHEMTANAPAELADAIEQAASQAVARLRAI